MVAGSGPMTSVIIPAHNEEPVIGRLLKTLLAEAEPNEFDVLVVCNGCADHTADVAARFGVRVIELAQGSKHLALVAGDAASHGFPRLYVDADVELDTGSARALIGALDLPGVLAVSPQRQMQLSRSSWPVRAYYRVWAQLPAVREGLFGRGVLAVSELGYQRIADRPQVLGDDLWLHSQFAPEERRVIDDSISVIHGPRTVRDLIRRRVRAAQGNRQLSIGSTGATDTSAASGRALLRLARHEPALWPSLPVFVVLTLVARVQARRLKRTGKAELWLRDESSRS
jgi:glycosyltransferase involved in cell wall biosynthesis